MATNRIKRNRGISLLEALIALAVLAFGLLGIAKLHSELVHSTAVAKARAEAVQLAEGKIEEMRNLVLSGQHTDLVGEGPDNQTGVNATFTWTTSIDKSQDSFLVSALVTWHDARADPVEDPPNQEVELQSELGWSSRVLSARMSTDGGSSSLDKIQPPTGLAKFGSDEDQALAPGDFKLVGAPRDDGTEIRMDNDGYSQLVSVQDGTENVLLTMQATENDRTFGIISGRVYFDTQTVSFGTRQNDVYVRDVRIIPSDTVLCTRVFDGTVDFGTGDRTTLLAITSDDLFGPDDEIVGDEKRYFKYYCYVGERWYGNVGIVRLDSAPLNHRVCVGDPLVDEPDSANPYSRHPQLQTVRKYRGNRYREDDPEQGLESVGLTGEMSGDVPVQLDGNHFLITRITGGGILNDSICKVPLERAVHDVELRQNPGEFVCLPGEFCSAQAGEDPPFSILRGEIEYVSLDQNPPIGPWTLMVDGFKFPDSCSDAAGELNVVENEMTWSGTGAYECTIPRPGWTGVGTWDGTLVAPPGYSFTTPSSGELTEIAIDAETVENVVLEME